MLKSYYPREVKLLVAPKESYWWRKVDLLPVVTIFTGRCFKKLLEEHKKALCVSAGVEYNREIVEVYFVLLC